jgi:alpha-L-arabinofuranosidase
MGFWLDWMTQGTRVSSNLVHDSEFVDILVEVNHGPFVLDNNLLLSKKSLWDCSEGGCYAHNLFGGEILLVPATPEGRLTPYQKPHSVEVAGYSVARCGDSRFYNNIFVGGGLEEYAKEKFLPSFAEGNIYLNGAKAHPAEKNSVVMSDFNSAVNVVQQGESFYLHTTLPEIDADAKRPLVTTEMLGTTMTSGLGFMNYDAGPLKIDRDYFDKKRNIKSPAAGPFEKAGRGELVLKVK